MRRGVLGVVLLVVVGCSPTPSPVTVRTTPAPTTYTAGDVVLPLPASSLGATVSGSGTDVVTFTFPDGTVTSVRSQRSFFVEDRTDQQLCDQALGTRGVHVARDDVELTCDAIDTRGHPVWLHAISVVGHWVTWTTRSSTATVDDAVESWVERLVDAAAR